nr:beta-D-glucosyl crocetin beta-1,6-glucosyltransferase-like [Tanacetum cinerariifolium]
MGSIVITCLKSLKKVIPIGPLIRVSSEEDSHEHIEIFRWLDKKKESSVVFLSFGSEYFLSESEIEDIAYGLERSNVNFIWVIRFPEGSTTGLKEVLPFGFHERLGERGMVIEKWAPQYPSTGGFMSHCGWGSVMESIYYGVPFLQCQCNMTSRTMQGLWASICISILIMDFCLNYDFEDEDDDEHEGGGVLVGCDL